MCLNCLIGIGKPELSKRVNCMFRMRVQKGCRKFLHLRAIKMI